MGIKFLTQFLFKNTIDINDPRLTDQQLPHGSQLVIDGFNYLHYLMDKYVLNLGPHLNGTYNSMRSSFRSDIIELREYMGLEIIFVFDGQINFDTCLTIDEDDDPNNLTMRKMAVFKKNNKSGFDSDYAKWGNLESFSKMGLKFPTTNLISPPLILRLFREVLSEMQVDVRYSGRYEEADDLMAKICIEGNNAQDQTTKYPKYYCYTNDTDLLIMKNCPTVFIGQIYGNKYTGVRCNRLWTRTLLAELMGFGCKEELFVEFCLMLGNEFTMGFDIEEFFNPREATDYKCLPEDSFLRAGFIRSVFKDRPADYRLRSRDLSFQRIIHFFRARYNGDMYERQCIFPESEYRQGLSAKSEYRQPVEEVEEDVLNTDLEVSEVRNQKSWEEKNYKRYAKLSSLQKQYLDSQLDKNEIQNEFSSSNTVEFLKSLIKTIASISSSTKATDVTSELDSGRTIAPGAHVSNDAKDRLGALGDSTETATVQREEKLREEVAVVVEEEEEEEEGRELEVAVELVDDDGDCAQPFAPIWDNLSFYNQMIDKLNDPSFTPAINNEFHEVNGTIEAVRSAHLYQLVIEYIFRHYPKTLPENCISVCKLFDGYVFHGLINDFLYGRNATEEEEEEIEEVGVNVAGRVDYTVPNQATNGQLPVEDRRVEIVGAVTNLKHQITFIQGQTGCGKSTMIPLLLHIHYDQNYENAARETSRVLVVQPRSIAALSLATYVAEQVETLALYENCRKPTIGLDVLEVLDSDTLAKLVDPGVADITYSTSDRFIRSMAEDRNYMRRFKVVIIDEIHERTIYGDIVSLLLKKYLKLSPSVRVVLMSAAANFDKYKEYYSSRDIEDTDEFQEPGVCNYLIGDLITIPHTMFEITTIYIDEICLETDGNIPAGMQGVFNRTTDVNAIYNFQKVQDLVKSFDKICEPAKAYLRNPYQFFHDNQLKVAAKVIKTLGNRPENPVNTFLVFVDGPWDVFSLSMELKRGGRNERGKEVVIRGIQAELNLKEMRGAFDTVEEKFIKVIIATDVGESSITLPDVGFVICLGTSMSQSVNTSSGIAEFERTWISKDSAIQRSGRTGRVCPGTVLRLYSQKIYERMIDHTRPEIDRSPLYDGLMYLHSFFEYAPYYSGILPITNSMLDPPAEEKIELAYDYLIKVGFMEFDNTTMTEALQTQRGRLDLSQVSRAARLTSGGKFALQLPCDCHFAKIIVQGIILGIGAEAIVIAAMINERSPFAVTAWANQYEDSYTVKYEEQSKKNIFALAGQRNLDLGYFSEPTMLLHIYLLMKSTPKDSIYSTICREYGLHGNASASIMKPIQSMFNSVNRAIYHLSSQATVRYHPSQIKPLSPNQVQLLKVLFLWNNSCLIKQKINSTKKNSSSYLDSEEIFYWDSKYFFENTDFSLLFPTIDCQSCTSVECLLFFSCNLLSASENDLTDQFTHLMLVPKVPDGQLQIHHAATPEYVAHGIRLVCKFHDDYHGEENAVSVVYFSFNAPELQAQRPKDVVNGLVVVVVPQHLLDANPSLEQTVETKIAANVKNADVARVHVGRNFMFVVTRFSRLESGQSCMIKLAEANILRVDLSHTFDEAFRFHFNRYNSSLEFSFIAKQDALHQDPLQLSLQQSKRRFSETISSVIRQLVDTTAIFHAEDTYQLSPKRTVNFKNIAEDWAAWFPTEIDQTTLGVRYMQWAQDMATSIILFPTKLPGSDLDAAHTLDAVGDITPEEAKVDAPAPNFKQFTIKACDKKSIEWKLVSISSHKTFRPSDHPDYDPSIAARTEQNELAEILAREQGLSAVVTKPFIINDGLSSIFEDKKSFMASCVYPRNLVGDSEEFYAVSLMNRAKWRGPFYFNCVRQTTFLPEGLDWIQLVLKCDRLYVNGDRTVSEEVDHFAQSLFSSVKNFEFVPDVDVSDALQKILASYNDETSGKLISEDIFHHGGLTLKCLQDANYVCYSCSDEFASRAELEIHLITCAEFAIVRDLFKSGNTEPSLLFKSSVIQHIDEAIATSRWNEFKLLDQVRFARDGSNSGYCCIECRTETNLSFDNLTSHCYQCNHINDSRKSPRFLLLARLYHLLYEYMPESNQETFDVEGRLDQLIQSPDMIDFRCFFCDEVFYQADDFFRHRYYKCLLNRPYLPRSFNSRLLYATVSALSRAIDAAAIDKLPFLHIRYFFSMLQKEPGLFGICDDKFSRSTVDIGRGIPGNQPLIRGGEFARTVAANGLPTTLNPAQLYNTANNGYLLSSGRSANNHVLISQGRMYIDNVDITDDRPFFRNRLASRNTYKREHNGIWATKLEYISAATHEIVKDFIESLKRRLREETLSKNLFVNSIPNSYNFEIVINKTTFAGLREGLMMVVETLDDALTKWVSDTINISSAHRDIIAQEMRPRTATMSRPPFNWDADHRWLSKSSFQVRAHPGQLRMILRILDEVFMQRFGRELFPAAA